MGYFEFDTSKHHRNVKIYTPFMFFCLFVLLCHSLNNKSSYLIHFENSNILLAIINAFDILSDLNLLGWYFFLFLLLIVTTKSWYIVGFEHSENPRLIAYMFLMICLLFPYFHFFSAALLLIWVYEWIYAKKRAFEGNYKQNRKNLGKMLLVLIGIVGIINFIWMSAYSNISNFEEYGNISFPSERDRIVLPLKIVFSVISYIVIYVFAFLSTIKYTKTRSKGDKPDGGGIYNFPLAIFLTAPYFIFIHRFIHEYTGPINKNQFALLFCITINILPLIIIPNVIYKKYRRKKVK